MQAQVDSEVPSRLILGLGNPGDRYRLTRHNVGFQVVEELARRRGLELVQSECRSRIARDVDVTLALPQTYMNRSGYAARCLVEMLGFQIGNVLVVLDDTALPLGRLRMRRGGSPGGHRGLESVVENLRTDQVPRLRLGIGPEDESLSREPIVDFVLSPFTADERQRAEEMIVRAADACEVWLGEGIEAAMNQFNA